MTFLLLLVASTVKKEIRAAQGCPLRTEPDQTSESNSYKEVAMRNFGSEKKKKKKIGHRIIDNLVFIKILIFQRRIFPRKRRKRNYRNRRTFFIESMLSFFEKRASILINSHLMDTFLKEERLLRILKRDSDKIFFRDRELHSLFHRPSRYVNPFVATCQTCDTLVAFQHPCARVIRISILFEMYFIEYIDSMTVTKNVIRNRGERSLRFFSSLRKKENKYFKLDAPRKRRRRRRKSEKTRLDR